MEKQKKKKRKTIKGCFQVQYNEPALHGIERLGKEVLLLTDLQHASNDDQSVVSLSGKKSYI